MTILLTGGAGYIGSHTALALLQRGFDVLVLDNLSNSLDESLRRVALITGCDPLFVHGDVRDRPFLDNLFAKYRIDAVLHFAGLKAVEESIMQPLSYYDNNVNGTQVLLQAMENAGIYKFVFSSSATVYGNNTEMPVSENSLLGPPTNPYGRSKIIVEDILRDLTVANPRWSIAILRYFNPVGAHESGLIGEDPNGIPNNLLPYIAQVAVGKLPELTIFGDDYPTPDGTGVRDYIHVADLAEGHLFALEAMQKRTGTHVWNLGTGHGYSVLEMVRAFESATGKTIPYAVRQRRLGDTAICCADPSKAELELGWKAKRGLDQMMHDAWRWQSMNPNGYR